MKLWVALTILLYILCVSILAVPLLSLADGSKIDASDLLAAFYLYFMPVLLLAQGFLLLVPVGIVQERPVKRRGIVASAVIGSIPMALLTFIILFSIVLMVGKERTSDSYVLNRMAFVYLGVFWLGWGIVFLKGYKDRTSLSFISRITKWLLRGSILELVVAIPSHVISRQRRECCAPAESLLGIAMGLAIALMSFGPGIFFLFAQRIRNKKGKQHIAPVD